MGLDGTASRALLRAQIGTNGCPKSIRYGAYLAKFSVGETWRTDKARLTQRTKVVPFGQNLRQGGKMITRYIGITDFMSGHRARAMRDVFVRAGGPGINRRLAVGVMMSRKTLCGLPTAWSSAFPKNEEIAQIFQDDRGAVFNVLHYADYSDVQFEQCLRMASAFGGPRMQAVQLDMKWPDVEIIRSYRETQNDVAIILQVGKSCFDDAKDQPAEIVRRLAPYAGVIDAVLLDRSMGSGTLLDPARTLPHLEAISTAYPQLGLVVAGGLGPETLHVLVPILQKFPQVSIDAQGRLRRSRKATDPIDWDLAEDYIRAAVRAF